MADEGPIQQQAAPGGHYSGKNKIPTVGQFIERLDKDKKDRDRQIDEANGPVGGEAVPHKREKKQDAGKTVTDPTTGKQVVVADVNEAFIERSQNPTLSVPNANLGKDTTVKTEASQKNPEYKEKQDITAPPDPVAEGSTSDVPIHGFVSLMYHPRSLLTHIPNHRRKDQHPVPSNPQCQLRAYFCSLRGARTMASHRPLLRNRHSGTSLWRQVHWYDSLGHVRLQRCVAMGQGSRPFRSRG